MGSQKCVVVLGVKRTDINQNFCPTFDNAEPLAIRPLHTCPGEVINEILEEAIAITNSPPIAVISDEGSELKKGVRLFTKNHSETIHLFDGSHKINNCLKEELNNDSVWLAFQTAAAASIQHLKLSSIAYLIPPRQRSKERMHSAFHLIEWGMRSLKFLDSEKAKALTVEERAKLEWLRQYQFAFPTYMYFKEACEKALDLIHEQGYFFNIADEFLRQTEHLYSTDQRNILFKNKLMKILEEEGKKIPERAHYPGSSEILESVFGKFKAMEDNHASSGLTSLVLAIPALVGGLSESIVERALERVSALDVKHWIKKNMGQTFLSQRRYALNTGYKECIELDLDICD